MEGIKTDPCPPLFELNFTPPLQFCGASKTGRCVGILEQVPESPVLPSVTLQAFHEQKLCLLIPILNLEVDFFFFPSSDALEHYGVVSSSSPSSALRVAVFERGRPAREHRLSDQDEI